MKQSSTRTKRKRRAAKTSRRHIDSSNSQIGNSVRSGHQRILNFVLGMTNRYQGGSVPRTMVAEASGIKESSFKVTISAMKQKGLIQYDPDSIRLTEIGRSNAQGGGNDKDGTGDTTYTEIVNNMSVQDDIKRRFRLGGQYAILYDAIRDGDVYDRESLGNVFGLENKKSVAVLLSRMKRNGILEYDRTTVRLTDMNFPMGRPVIPTAV